MDITKKGGSKPEYILDRSFEEEEKDPNHVSSPLTELSISQAIESIGMGKFQYIVIFVMSWNFLSTSFQYILPGIMLPTFFKEFEIGSFELSVYGFCEYCGYLTGAVLSYVLSESFGRRKMILVTLIFAAIVTALCSLIQNFTFIVIFRFLAINALVINYYYSYSFLLELLPPKTKKNLGVYFQIMSSLGTVLCILLASWVFETLDYGNWQLLMLLAAILIWIAFTLNAVILEESPYYNMKKGNTEAAYVVINKIAKFNIKNPEFMTLEKKRRISNWFIKNESSFNIMKKSKGSLTEFEDQFNLGLILIWAIDLFIFHGFDFVLPIFMVLQKNAIHPLFKREELLSDLLTMHLIGCCYILLAFFTEKVNFRRKIFAMFLELAAATVSLFMGLNMAPSFLFWMVVFKLLLNLYTFFKMQIVSQTKNDYYKGVTLRTVKIYGKIGMIASPFLLVFFLSMNIYLIYFIFAGLLCVNLMIWPTLDTSLKGVNDDEIKTPLNVFDFKQSSEEFDNIYRIIEIPI